MKRFLASLLAILLLCTLCGCEKIQQTLESGKENLHDKVLSASDTTLEAMDTVMQLRLFGDDDGEAARELKAILESLDATLSITDPSSALYALNLSGSSGEPTILALLQAAAAFTERTGGAVDASVAPAVRLWGFAGENYRIPLQSEIDQILKSVGMSHVHLKDDIITLDPGSALDFGAFAKGWAADRCREALEARGLPAILSLGGNIQTVGEKPDGEDWVIGIADPEQPSDYCLTLRLQGSRAVVTTGDYQRYFEYEGKRYCHIFDPATGRPVDNGLRSVTVVCDSGLTADALSTALFVMGPEGAERFWRASNDFEMILIDAEGSISLTEGLADAAGDADVTVIRR